MVGPHASDDAVGELTLVGSPGLLAGLTLRPLACKERLAGIVVAGLSYRHDIENAVDGPVAQKVEAVPDRFAVCLSRGGGDRR